MPSANKQLEAFSPSKDKSPKRCRWHLCALCHEDIFCSKEEWDRHRLWCVQLHVLGGSIKLR